MSSMIVNDHHDARTREGIARPYRRLFIRRPGEDLSPSRRRFNMFKRSTLEAYSGVIGALTKSINHCMAGEESGNSNDGSSQTGVVVGAVRVVDPHESPILIPAPEPGTRCALRTGGNALKNLDESNDASDAHLGKAPASARDPQSMPATVNVAAFASALGEDSIPVLQHVSELSKAILDSSASENEVNAAESTDRPGCSAVPTPGSTLIALSVYEQVRETDSHTARRTDRKESRVSSGTTQGSSSKASVPVSSVSQDSTSSSLASVPDLQQTNPRELQRSNNAERWFFSEHLYRNVRVPRRRSICSANSEGATGRKDSAQRMAELIQSLDLEPMELARVAQNDDVESPVDQSSAIHSSDHFDSSRAEEPSSTHQEPHCMRQEVGSAGIDSSLGQVEGNSSAIVIAGLAPEVYAPETFNTATRSSNNSGATCAARVYITANHSSDETAAKASGHGANEYRLSHNSGPRPLRCRTRNQLNSIDDEGHSGLPTPIQGAIQIDGSEPERATSGPPTRPESSGSVLTIPAEGPEIALRPCSTIEPSGPADEDAKSTHKKVSIQVEVDGQTTVAPVPTTTSERRSSGSDHERRLSSSEWLEHLQIGGSMLMVFVPRHRPLYTIEEQEEGEGEDEDEDEEEGDEVSLPSSPDSSAPVTPISGPFPLPGVTSEAGSSSQAAVVPLLSSRRCGVRGTRRSDFGDGHPF
ncbi:hypothetical protein BDV93DRAFT_607234 [Ceratobasidium sp. AG-I]|nr:hypothetical protein BDV93DRAFT_607234 [Ceratobasidium sp. AG-I]